MPPLGRHSIGRLFVGSDCYGQARHKKELFACAWLVFLSAVIFCIAFCASALLG